MIFDPVTLVVLLSAIILTTLSGPFGTHAALKILPRLIFWAVTLSTALLFGSFIHYLFRLRMPEDRQVEAEVVSSGTFVVIFGGFMLAWVMVFTGYASPIEFDLPWLRILIEIAVVTAGLLAIRVYIVRRLAGERRGEQPEATASMPGAPLAQQFEPRLMRRLPDIDKAPILWLTSENHFVEIHTAKGCSRVRMRLTDAIDEMEGVVGSCVHRSHWVAYDAIDSAQKENGYWRLNLRNGETVPVSRKYQPLLEEAGLLDRLAIA